ncbi:glycosyltransferase [Mycolicibacterium sp. ELW1]|uniref:glycosyltransferase n=1 Tax=Mycobacteriaceae TaxID=1762 RepID=UPI0011EC6821|nr:glycosyltransferase [Mycobacterium sp. ELW1]QEN13255.1 glycosyltransferase [Mycobacterium sp. ELW1]
MKFALVNWGSRGEIEPCAAVGRELLRRGHDVHIAVAPDLVGFAESVGLTAVAFGPRLNDILGRYRDFWTSFFRAPWRIRSLGRMYRDFLDPLSESRSEMIPTLAAMAQSADLVLTTMNFEEVAVSVAERYNIPLATLQWFPLRANGRLLPIRPAWLGRSIMTAFQWVAWRGSKNFEDAQRYELGLPKSTSPWARRIREAGCLEIQAYDEVCFPGLAEEWQRWDRPFVGALTMELATDDDEEVASWIAAGTPPIFFGFGSMPVESPADAIAMIGSACAQLGERALVCAGSSDFSDVPELEHVKVVGALNFATIFPTCRAVVHHGGAGTTALGLRAGVPTLILSTDINQRLWGTSVKRLGVGTARRFSSVTRTSLVADLRHILRPDFVARARELAAGMTEPAKGAALAADLVERYAQAHSRTAAIN